MSEEVVDNQTPEAGQSDPQVVASTWKDGLEESIKGHPSLDNVDDVPTLAKNYVNAQDLIGRKGILKPKEGDAQDELRYYRELGMPEKADEYELSLPETLDERVKPFYNEDVLKEYKDMAHRYKMPKGQFEQLANEFIQKDIAKVNRIFEQQEQAMKAEEAALRTEWGQGYDDNVSLAEKAYKAFGGEGDLKTNPKALKVFANVAKQVSDDILTKTETVRMTPADALNEAKKIMGDFKGAYYNLHDPEHEAVVRKVKDLYKLAGK